MAQTSEVITALPQGAPKGTDQTPATDTTDTSSAPTGTTKKYLRSDELNFYLHAQGIVTYSAVQVATTTALTATYANGASGVGATLTNAGAQSALTIDGVALPLGARVLVKNQASTADNGIYTVTLVGSASTNWVMTRSVDYNTPAQIIQYAVVLSDQGLTQAGLLWQETGAGPWTIGTTAIVFAQYMAVSTSGAVLLSPSSNQTILNGFLGITSGSFLAFDGNGFTAFSPTSNTGSISLTSPNDAGNYSNSLTSASTTAARTWTLPDASGTIALTGSSGETFDGDSGSATPSAGTLTISGGSTGLTTLGSGSKISLLGTLGIGYGGTAVTSVTTVPAATAFAGWDANKNLSANSFISAYATTATAAGTTTLTVASKYYQYFTGTTTQTAVMPVATTLVEGQSWYFVNNSTGVVTVESSGTNTIQTMAGGSSMLITCILNSGTSAASWNAQYFVDSDVSGAVLLAPSSAQTITTYGLTLPSITFSSTTGIVGTTTNNNAAAGSVGQAVSSVIASGGTAIAITNNTPTDMTSISLTAGDWDVWGNIFFTYTGNSTLAQAWTATTSASTPFTADDSLCNANNYVLTSGEIQGISVPYQRYSLATTTTVYISGLAMLTTGTANMCGGIYARRVR